MGGWRGEWKESWRCGWTGQVRLGQGETISGRREVEYVEGGTCASEDGVNVEFYVESKVDGVEEYVEVDEMVRKWVKTRNRGDGFSGSL